MTGPAPSGPAIYVPTKGQISVTDRTVLMKHPQILADALNIISMMMRRDSSSGTPRVVIVEETVNRGLSPNADVVQIDMTNRPEDRDELVAALGGPAPFDWQGQSTGRRYREWRGVLLTMPVLVWENLTPAPPASDPASDVVPSPSPVPSCSGAPADSEAACGEPGPHGPHPLGDAAPEEDTPVVIRPAAPGEDSPDPELVPADAEHWADPATAAAWRAYARARARAAFVNLRFPTPTAAVLALDKWPGRTMLTDGDVAQLASELLAIPPAPERVRPRPYVAWPVARMRAVNRNNRHGAHAVVGPVNAGPVNP